MTKPTPETDHDRTAASEPSVSQRPKDRIAARGERTGLTLNPGRGPDEVSYPDRLAPMPPPSSAEIQIAQTRDAGQLKAAPGSLISKRPGMALWIAITVSVLLALLILIVLV